MKRDWQIRLAWTWFVGTVVLVLAALILSGCSKDEPEPEYDMQCLLAVAEELLPESTDCTQPLSAADLQTYRERACLQEWMQSRPADLDRNGLANWRAAAEDDCVRDDQ